MKKLAVACVFVLFCIGCTMPPPVRVMTFNIRFGTAPDGENAWEHRRQMVMDAITSNAPDVIGMQEVLDFQAVELCEALPDYKFIGVGRDDGARQGEFAPIMYNSKLFKLVDCGYFWLSKSPDQPGVKGWDAACPRMLTWARFGFKRYPMNSFYVLNTHFDHVGKQARLESAQLIRRMIDSLGGKPVVLVGDFNCGPDSPPHKALTADKGNLAEMHDVHVARGHSEIEAGTFNGFRGETAGSRIDWIMYNRRFEPVAYEIDHRSKDGRYPSDHFPVIAVLKLLSATWTGAM